MAVGAPARRPVSGTRGTSRGKQPPNPGVQPTPSSVRCAPAAGSGACLALI
jgi:hypothetical protein